MPSIAATINALLNEDMYSTEMLDKMDDRIHALNDGQLKLLMKHLHQKAPTLTNPMWKACHEQMIAKATLEKEHRIEEEGREEKERLKELKEKHAGVHAKAWDKKHASLDKELAQFQKFLKKKARTEAEQAIRGDEQARLYQITLTLPERRIRGRRQRLAFWLLAAGSFACLIVLAVEEKEIPQWLTVILSLLLALGAAFCLCLGLLRGVVKVIPTEETVLEKAIKEKQKKLLKSYEKEMKQNYIRFEKEFEAEISWLDTVKVARQATRAARAARHQRREMRKEELMMVMMKTGSTLQPADVPADEAIDHLDSLEQGHQSCQNENCLGAGTISDDGGANVTFSGVDLSAQGSGKKCTGGSCCGDRSSGNGYVSGGDVGSRAVAVLDAADNASGGGAGGNVSVGSIDGTELRETQAVRAHTLTDVVVVDMEVCAEVDVNNRKLTSMTTIIEEGLAAVAVEAVDARADAPG